MADLDFVVVEVRGDLVRGPSWIRAAPAVFSAPSAVGIV